MTTHEITWRLFHTRRELPRPQITDPLIETFAVGLDDWLDANDVLDGQPYLIDPQGHYDVQLNRYFRTYLSTAPINSQRAAASDLKLWLTFLWTSRGRRNWREATEDDRAAYKHWRTVNPRGPHVDLVTWDREVALVNQFYLWAVKNKQATGCMANPITQRETTAPPGYRHRAASTPAEASHQGPRNDVKWFPPATYQQWREVGLRGFTPLGLPDPSFRGRFASRNATYADLMIRTGLRLSEQTSLSLFELPRAVRGQVFTRTWLPASIAKNGSARWIYLRDSALHELWEYVEEERADAVEYARSSGAYERIRRPLVVHDRSRPQVEIAGQAVRVDQLDHAERLRLLIETPDGLEPAALWLNEDGLPSSPSCWQEVFKSANTRCRRHQLPLRANPHMLRHSFAVITLQQLWAGHLKDMGELNPGQRRTHQMVFGDPLNWLRIRLGHRSVVTTLCYLHALEELEMETRMALIPEDWGVAAVPDDSDYGDAPKESRA